MAKPGQVLIIDPANELKFRGPFNVPVTSYMRLTNPTDKKVFFKIKTTAPKKYCVRPNAGSLVGKGVMEVSICLQPFIYDPLEKNKHKFMVQTVIAPDGETNIEALFKDLPSDQLMDSKLKCVFEILEPGVVEAEPSPESQDAVDERSKCMGDSKALPKVATGDGELQKAAVEVKQLREEHSSLRQENMQLRDELLRMRRAPNTSTGEHSNSYSPPTATSTGLPPTFMMAAILLTIVGIIIGKFFL